MFPLKETCVHPLETNDAEIAANAVATTSVSVPV